MCADACLAAGDVRPFAVVIKCARDCALFCFMAATLLECESPFLIPYCTFCADACETCAVACQKHDNADCIFCRDACLKLSIELKALVQGYSKRQ